MSSKARVIVMTLSISCRSSELNGPYCTRTYVRDTVWVGKGALYTCTCTVHVHETVAVLLGAAVAMAVAMRTTLPVHTVCMCRWAVGRSYPAFLPSGDPTGKSSCSRQRSTARSCVGVRLGITFRGHHFSALAHAEPSSVRMFMFMRMPMPVHPLRVQPILLQHSS
jgi:hypothetical protein